MIVVYKLGGSLLALPDLAERVRRLLARDRRERALLIVGGGAAAELVREWDRVHRLGDAVAHRLALAAMSLNARLLCKLLPEAVIVRDMGAATAVWRERGLPILDVEAPDFAVAAAVGDALPESWDVTSDSIAAWVAIHWGAGKLVLAKSVGRPPGNAAAAAAGGDVDSFFPILATRLRSVEWVNLRSAQPQIEPWLR